MGDRSWSRAGRLRGVHGAVAIRPPLRDPTPAADEGDHDQRQPGRSCGRIGGRQAELPRLSGSRSGCALGRLPVVGVARGVGEGCALLLGWVEPGGGVVVEEGSQLGEAPVFQKTRVAREVLEDFL